MAVDGPPQGPAPEPPAAAPGPPPAPAGRRIGPWTIDRELGRGGMGAVYLAEHEATHERVAMKELLITAAADPVAVKRFLQEGEVMQRLRHPNIVQVRDIIEAGGGHYIALEFINGGSLRDLLKGRPLPTPMAFAVMHGLLQALDHAHQHAIVHRDVKPENVMLSAAGEVKVADFGIARLTDDSPLSHATKTGTTVGTPQYMSPEQVTTSKVDGRSDLYSAGIVCYEVFCGRPPFEATAEDGPFTLFAKHVQAPPPPPTVIRPGLDPRLETVILKSLAKRPEDRYQTGAEFDRDLSQIALRLCGPDWVHALEPGADLARMVPAVAPTMVMIPTAAPGAGPAAIPAAAVAPVAAAPPPAAGAPAGYAPRPPASAASRKPAGGSSRMLYAGVAAAIVVVALVGGLVAFLARPGRAPVTTPTAPPTAAAGACTFLAAGTPPAPGSGGACGVRLGAQVQADDLAGQSALPADLVGSGFTAAGMPHGTAKVPVSGGFATLTSSSRGAGVGVLTAKTTATAGAVVIADFTPTTATDASIGLGADCSASDCLLLFLSPSGQVEIAQVSGGAAPVSKINQSATVRMNQVNRLVMAVSGTQVTAWLNGSQVASVQVDPPSPGAATFYDIDQAASGASTAELGALYVFTPGS